MFCLEVFREDDDVIPLVFNQYSRGTCDCRINTHVGCWISYTAHKGHVECPICHTVVHQPTQTQRQNQNQNQQIEVVHNNQVYQYRISPTPGTHQLVIPTQSTVTRTVYCSKSRCSTFIFIFIFAGLLTMYYASKH